MLSDDYSKVAFLCADRSLSFHARFGTYFKTRTPRQGRDLAYCASSAELLVVGSAPEVYRLHLEEGRYMSPLPSTSAAINACGACARRGVLCCVVLVAGRCVARPAHSAPARWAAAHACTNPRCCALLCADAACAGISPLHGLFATAGEDGRLECWDLRQREAVGVIDAAAAAGAPGGRGWAAACTPCSLQRAHGVLEQTRRPPQLTTMVRHCCAL